MGYPWYIQCQAKYLYQIILLLKLECDIQYLKHAVIFVAIKIESDLNYYLVKLWFLFYCLSECYINAYLVRNCLYLVDIVLPN